VDPCRAYLFFFVGPCPKDEYHTPHMGDHEWWALHLEDGEFFLWMLLSITRGWCCTLFHLDIGLWRPRTSLLSLWRHLGGIGIDGWDGFEDGLTGGDPWKDTLAHESMTCGIWRPKVSLLHNWHCILRSYVTLLGHDVTLLGFDFM